MVIVGSLSLFHTLSYHFEDKLDLTLYQQRQGYFESEVDSLEMKHIYEYYQGLYEWCLVKLDQGKVAIQVYPKEKRSAAWK
jgi:hypothetical protein